MQVSIPPANPAVERILDTLGLTPDQRRAAARRGQDVFVTAGAGSGKTRTLVARYIGLLAEGLSPRRVTAITFTEKAAREMRSRVRSALAQQITQADTLEERRRWDDIDAQLDAARIGTIHSLCAEILRSHPAEAGVDPRFEVLDEGLAATLRAQSVAETLDWLVGEPQFSPLLKGMTTRAAQTVLAFLLDRRLEAQAAFDRRVNAQDGMRQMLQAGVSHPSLAEPLESLRDLQSAGQLREDASDKLATQVEGLLDTWALIEGFY